MKKLPILLSTIAVTASGVGAMTTLALDTAKETESTGGLVAPAIEDQANELDVLNRVANAYDNRAYISAVDEKESKAVFTFGLPEGWTVGRVVVARYKFEAGVLESEADTKMEGLGTSAEQDWAVILSDKEGSFGQWLYTAGFATGSFPAQNPNILYYAVRVKRKEAVEGEINEYWIRGKVNYRACQKSTIFDEKTMTCGLKKKLAGTERGFQMQTRSPIAYVDYPENDTFQSWHDEWLEIQETKWQAASLKYDTLNTNLRKAAEYLDNLDKTMAELGQVVPTITGADSLLTRTQNLTNSVVKLREYYNFLLGSNNQTEIETWKEKIKTLEGEKAGLESANGTLKAEKEDLQMQNQAIGAQNLALEGKIAELEQKLVELEKNQNQGGQGNQGSQGGQDNPDNQGENNKNDNNQTNAGGSGQDEMTGGSSSGLSQGAVKAPAVIENKSKTTETIIKTVTVEAKTEKDQEKTEPKVTLTSTQTDEKPAETENLEVPTLGGEAEKFSWWWLLIPVVMAAGGIGMWLRRALGGRKS